MIYQQVAVAVLAVFFDLGETRGGSRVLITHDLLVQVVATLLQSPAFRFLPQV